MPTLLLNLLYEARVAKHAARFILIFVTVLGKYALCIGLKMRALIVCCQIMISVKNIKLPPLLSVFIQTQMAQICKTITR